MITLNWSSSYNRSFRKAIKKDTGLKDRILTAMKLLEEDPFHPKLKSHKLKGILEDNWAYSVDYDLRIIFTFVKNPQFDETEILLMDIGTHEEVY